MTGGLTAPSLTYSEPETRYLTITSHHFQPWLNSYDVVYYDAYLYPNSGSGSMKFFTGVSLPDGATITQVNVYTADYSTTGKIYFMLTNRNLIRGTEAFMAEAGGTTAGNQGYQLLTDNSINYPVINNSSNYYMIKVQFDGTLSHALQFRAVRITYTVPSPD